MRRPPKPSLGRLGCTWSACPSLRSWLISLAGQTHSQRGHPLPPHGQHRLVWRPRRALRLWRRRRWRSSCCSLCTAMFWPRRSAPTFAAGGAAKSAASVQEHFQAAADLCRGLGFGRQCSCRTDPGLRSRCGRSDRQSWPDPRHHSPRSPSLAHPHPRPQLGRPVRRHWCQGFVGAGDWHRLDAAHRRAGAVRDVLLLCSCLPTAINALILTVRFDARPDLLGGILIARLCGSPGSGCRFCSIGSASDCATS